MPPVFLIDPATIDTSKVLYDIEAIRRGNPQRFEMEHLTAIVQLNRDDRSIVGYKDVRADEFWVRGHMGNHGNERADELANLGVAEVAKRS